MFSIQTFALILLSFVVEATFVHSLKLKDSFAEEENVVMKRWNSFFQSSESTCVFSVPAENHDFLDLIYKELSVKNKLILVENSFTSIVKKCKNVLLLDVPSSSVCDLLRKDQRLYLGLKHNLVLYYLRAPADLTALQSCSSSFGLAVVKVLLHNGLVFVLNSPFASERHFVLDGSLTTSNTPSSFVTSLQGKRLGVAAFNFPPFSIIREKSDNVVEYDGMEMNLFLQLAEYLNFSWALVELKEPRPWGTRLPNNTVVGGLAQAIREDADVAFSNYWQRLEFLDSMDFGPPLNELYLSFLVRRPTQEHSRWQLLYATFSTQVWLLALLAFVSVTVTYWLGRRVRIYPARSKEIVNPTFSKSAKPLTRYLYCVDSETGGFSESALIIFGILTSSSSHAGPPRGLLPWWSFFALLFSTALTGSVVTRLAVPLYSPRLDTYRQAIEAGYYWVSPGLSRHSPYLISYMFNMQNPWQRMFAAKYRSKEPDELSELVESDPKVILPAQRWGNDMVILDIPGLGKSTDLSDFRIMRETTRDVFTSFVFKKESPLNELLSVATQSLIDRGLWDYWKRVHTSKGEPKRSKQLMVEKDLSSLAQPEPFTLLKLYPVFVLLIIGNCLAFFVFLVELCCYRICR